MAEVGGNTSEDDVLDDVNSILYTVYPWPDIY